MANENLDNSELEALKQELLKLIPADGSAIGNKALRVRLDWEPEKYQKVREGLIRDGTISTWERSRW
jgi:hypothetical protein